MQRVLIILVLAVAGMGVAGRATQAQEPATQPVSKVAYGTMVRLDGVTLILKQGAEELKIVTDEKTQVFIDGRPSSLAALTPGQRVFATTVDGVAVKLESMIRPPKP
jgi:hypothetical protein